MSDPITFPIDSVTSMSHGDGDAVRLRLIVDTHADPMNAAVADLVVESVAGGVCRLEIQPNGTDTPIVEIRSATVSPIWTAGEIGQRGASIRFDVPATCRRDAARAAALYRDGPAIVAVYVG